MSQLSRWMHRLLRGRDPLVDRIGAIVAEPQRRAEAIRIAKRISTTHARYFAGVAKAGKAMRGRSEIHSAARAREASMQPLLKQLRSSSAEDVHAALAELKEVVTADEWRRVFSE